MLYRLLYLPIIFFYVFFHFLHDKRNYNNVCPYFQPFLVLII